MCEKCDPTLERIFQNLQILKVKYVDGIHKFEVLKDYVQTSLSIRHNVENTSIVQNIKLEECIDGCMETKNIEMLNHTEIKKHCDPTLDDILQDLQKKYADGLNYLDQLKDYVESSLSVRQNAQKVE